MMKAAGMRARVVWYFLYMPLNRVVFSYPIIMTINWIFVWYVILALLLHIRIVDEYYYHVFPLDRERSQNIIIMSMDIFHEIVDGLLKETPRYFPQLNERVPFHIIIEYNVRLIRYFSSKQKTLTW